VTNVTAPVQSSAASKTISNLDLEGFKRTRLDSETAFEKRRKELGLPSDEERRQELAKISERARETALEIRSGEQESESYWRQRASSLRTEMLATIARIEFVQDRLNEISANLLGPFTSYVPFVSVDQLSIGPSFQTGVVARNVAVTQMRATSFGNGGFRGQVNFNNQFRVARPGVFPSVFPFPTLVSLPFPGYDNSYERLSLISELDRLRSERVALQSRWRDFEDVARRAGAYPGWLRP
jgi:hypothetical protein